MKYPDPEGEFMSCFGSTDPVTGKHKERLTSSAHLVSESLHQTQSYLCHLRAVRIQAE